MTGGEGGAGVKSKDSPAKEDTPPHSESLFLCFLMFFNVSLRIAHVYTPPPNICLYPSPQFQNPTNNPARLETGVRDSVVA